MEKCAAGPGSRGPERAVLLVGPQREQRIEVGQMVGRIGKITLGDKFNKMVFGVPHRAARAGPFALVQAAVQDAAGHGGIIVDSAAAAPAPRRKEERHGKILLAVWGGTLGVGGAVGPARPGKVPGVGAVLYVHIVHDPVPQGVKFGLVVSLYAEHHAVAHALGSDVVVARVLDVGKARPGGMVEAVSFVPVKNGMKCIFNAHIDLRLRIAQLRKNIAVVCGQGYCCHKSAPFVVRF